MKDRNGKKTAYPGIRRLAEDEYQVRVQVRHPGETKPKERERRVKGTLPDAVTAREAMRRELLDEFEREARQKELGLDPAKSKKETLSDYAGRWLEHLAKTGRNRVHVIQQHVHVLNKFVLPTMGKIEVLELTRRELVTWMEGLGDLKCGEDVYAKQTLNGAWATFRCLLKDALVLCDLPHDVTAGVRFRVRGKEPLEKDILTREELGRVLAQTEHESQDMRAMIWTGFTTGMRFGELSALQWDDVDFEAGIIHVRKSQVKGNVGPTKTNSRRTVPLHPVVADILRAHQAWQVERQVRGLHTGFLFLSETGKLRFSNVLTKPLQRCARNAGVKKRLSSHSMRRTFNNLARQAAGEIVARSMTGHTSTAMTEHYSHVSLEEKNKAIAAALGLLPAPPPTVN